MVLVLPLNGLLPIDQELLVSRVFFPLCLPPTHPTSHHFDQSYPEKSAFHILSLRQREMEILPGVTVIECLHWIR